MNVRDFLFLLVCGSLLSCVCKHIFSPDPLSLNLFKTVIHHQNPFPSLRWSGPLGDHLPLITTTPPTTLLNISPPMYTCNGTIWREFIVGGVWGGLISKGRDELGCLCLLFRLLPLEQRSRRLWSGKSGFYAENCSPLQTPRLQLFLHARGVEKDLIF